MTLEFWIVAGAILALLVLSAFFSGSETALTAVSSARMHHRARRGDARASAVRRLRADREGLIAAILLGNNLVNILAASLATSLLIGLFGEAGVAYATAAMTLLILVFAEVLPKTYAFNRADRVAPAVAPAIALLVRFFGPPALAVQWIVRGILRLSGIADQPPGGSEEHEEELRGAIELHRGEGEEIRDERRMLRSVLDLGDVSVGEVMTHRRNMAMVDLALPPGENRGPGAGQPLHPPAAVAGRLRQYCGRAARQGRPARDARKERGEPRRGLRSPPSPGSSRSRPPCSTSCMPSGAGGSISPSSWTNTARLWGW